MSKTTVVTAFQTTLAQALKSNGSETSITLASTTGLSSPAVVQIGSGTNAEWVSYSGISSTTLTGCVRGLKKNATSETDADSTIKKNHSIGEPVIQVEHSYMINNKPEADDNNTFSGNNSFTGTNTFSSTTKTTLIIQSVTTAQKNALTGVANGAIVYDTTVGDLFKYIGGSWIQVDSGGTFPDASETVAGKSEQATAAEQAASTETGATGAPLFVNPKNLVTTSSGAGDEGKLPTLNSLGKLATGFITAGALASYISDVTATAAQLNDVTNMVGGGSADAYHLHKGVLLASGYVVHSSSANNADEDITTTISIPAGYTAGQIILLIGARSYGATANGHHFVAQVHSGTTSVGYAQMARSDSTGWSFGGGGSGAPTLSASGSPSRYSQNTIFSITAGDGNDVTIKSAFTIGGSPGTNAAEAGIVYLIFQA